MPASPNNEHAKLEDEEIYETVLDHKYSARPDHGRIQSAQPSQQLAVTSFNTSEPEKSPNILKDGATGGIGEDTIRPKLYQPLAIVQTTNEGDYASRKI